MWSAQLALVPFHFKVIDSSVGVELGDEVPPLVNSFIDVCKDQLSSPRCTREMAAIALGKLLTRPDMDVALRQFGCWAVDLLRSRSACGGMKTSSRDMTDHVFRIPGVALSLATIFKIGRKGDTVVRLAQEVLPFAIELLQAQEYASNALVRKLCVKIIQRCALACMSLTPTFHVTGDEEGEIEKGGQHMWLEDPGRAEAVENAIDAMLYALEDKDTIVRWSVAKGMGRICLNLPIELAEEVMDSIMHLFRSPGASESTWHGGCLALAELTMRDLVHACRIEDIVPIVLEGLVFEIRRGYTSIGTNVRDAAAYVCWATARAHSRELLRPAVETLAPRLMAAACYDREVNCRRAAAAAFQECVGRLGTFPYGIDILMAADYFTVSLRTTVCIIFSK